MAVALRAPLRCAAVDPTRDSFPEPLVLTGERTLPGIPEENYWFQRHVVAYEFAAKLVAGKDVLDAGCGEGYGAALLARDAASVVGTDLEPEVVEAFDVTRVDPRRQQPGAGGRHVSELHLQERLTQQLVLNTPVFVVGTLIPGASHGAYCTGRVPGRSAP